MSISVMSDKKEQPTQFYREPWFWVVMAPLILTIFTSSIMVTIAVKGADDVVSDNYYKEGRMLEQPSTADEYAASLGLSAGLKIDLISGELIVDVNQTLQHEQLYLLVSHPADAHKDLNLALQRVSAQRYRIDLPSALDGRWYLRLSAQENDSDLWRLHGEIDLRQTERVVLQ